ncbi:MAG: hypothetical protein ACKVH8_11705 [Pirellulales bacterium]
MKSIHTKITTLVFLGCFCILQVASAQSTLIGPQPGILLLQNGSIFKGTITPSGDFLTIALSEGAVLRLPVNSVACQCKTMQEAYEFKRDQPVRLKLVDHLELTQWCITQKMYDQATHHLLFAVKSAPEDPRVLQMERRFRFALEPQKDATPLSPNSNTIPPIDRQQLEQMAGSLPLGGLRNFTSTVQPLLLKSCGTTTCHGQAGTTDFHLLRFEHIRSIPRLITLRNLHSTLKFINREEPTNSKIFKVFVDSHAAYPELSAPATREQVAVLSRWIYGISSNHRAPSRSNQLTQVKPELYQQVDRGMNVTNQAERTFNSPLNGEKSTDSTANSPMPGAGDLPAKSAPARPKEKKSYQAKDPFDPELFNRKYHPQR